MVERFIVLVHHSDESAATLKGTVERVRDGTLQRFDGRDELLRLLSAQEAPRRARRIARQTKGGGGR